MARERSGIMCVCIAGGLLLAGCATRTDLPRTSAAPVAEMRRKDALWL